jgi:hypothetical protein
MSESSNPQKKLGWRLIKTSVDNRPLMLDLLLAFGIVTFGMALILYAYLGIYSRYYADDFCMTAGFLNGGFWKSQIDLYNIWSPRFAGTFLLNLSEFFGRSSIQAWTALVVILWVLGVTWAIVQALQLTRLKVPAGLAVLIAEVLVFFTILNAPNQYQTLYWRIGLITYTLPLVFLAFLIGLIFNRVRKADPRHPTWGGSAACAILAFFAGGFSETYVTLQTGLLALALVFVWLTIRPPSRRNSRMLVGAALVGSLLALLVIVISPGNAVRLSAMPVRPHLFPFLRMAVTNAILFIYIFLKNFAFQEILALLVPLLILYTLHARDKNLPRLRPSSLTTALFLTPIVGALLILAVCMPSTFAESSYPEARVLIEARFILVALTIIEGVLIGLSLSQLHQWAQEPAPRFLQWFAAILFLLLCLYPLYDARKTIKEIPVYQGRAETWDARDALIRASLEQGVLDVNIKDSQAYSFDEFRGLSDLTLDSKNWVNQCAASFYGLHNLTVNGP